MLWITRAGSIHGYASGFLGRDQGRKTVLVTSSRSAGLYLSLVALVFVIVELLFTAGLSYDLIPEYGYSMVINDGNSEPTINLNIGMLVFSAIMYSLSAIFRYAALLQQLSDETV